MTNPEPANEGQIPPEKEPTPPAEQPQVPAESSSQPANPEQSAQAPANAAVDEGLPEWEPLTPELVEDEAIRGDFVIRWAVVGIALLFGFAAITETRTLIHVRSGEYLATHGLLPPATDVFSYTAADRKWVNLSWLFDLVAAGAHAVAGGIGLSLLQGILAGLTFGLLVHTTRAGIRTWWGSICAGLALLVCYPQFTVQPELITLLGLSTLLWLLVRFDQTGNPKTLWATVAVVWIWSQFDSRAFLGWLLLATMAIGESIQKSGDAGQRRTLWWKVTLAALLVTAIHPFHYLSLLAPVQLYGDYAALRQLFPRPGNVEVVFHSIASPAFWTLINHDSIAALVLLVATVVSLVLNRERLHPGHVIAVVIFNLLACVATHELAAASLVNCVICTINAQSWYRHRFGQVYSVDWRELLFSRGGRAVTVFCFFVLAWLVISGRIDGPGGRRTGLGFDDGLLVQMNSYQQLAAETDQLDDRPFHFAARQGDLLIWAGLRSFVDTRGGLFRGSADNDINALYDRTRKALQRKREIQPGSGEPTVWKATFEKYQITHVMPRLSGPSPAPDYLTFGDLMSTGEWILTDINASTAVFYHDEKRAPVDEYVKNHRRDFVQSAFRTEQKPPETTRVCAKAESITDSLFSVRPPRSPAGVQQASHYDQLAGASGTIPPATRAACALLAVRNATAGLRQDSNSAEGYRTLGLAYLILDRVETNLMSEAGFRWFSNLRYIQAVAAMQQAATLQPDDLLIRADLLGTFERTQRNELALECIRHIKRLRPVTAESTEQERKQREQLISIELNLEETLSKIETQINQGLENGADRFQVASAAYQAGAVRLAVKTLEEDAIYTQRHPMGPSNLGIWLIEVGRVQEGMDALEQSTVTSTAPGWRNTLAISLLVNADYNRAIDLWQSHINETSTNSSHAALLTLPFVTLNPLWVSADQYPFTHAAAAAEIVSNVRDENAALTFQIGLAQLEQGDVAAARKSLQYVYDYAPETHLRPLLKFYLQLLTDKKIEDAPIEPHKLEEFEPLGEEAAAKPQAEVTTPERKKN